jgi:hypothetical protein
MWKRWQGDHSRNLAASGLNRADCKALDISMCGAGAPLLTGLGSEVRRGQGSVRLSCTAKPLRRAVQNARAIRQNESPGQCLRGKPV